MAVSQQHGDIVGTFVGHHEVQLAIAVEVAYGHGDRTRPRTRAEGLCLLEGSIAVAQEHRDIIEHPVGDYQVGHPIAIEVAHGDRHRIISGCKISSGNERYPRLGRRRTWERRQEQ